MTSTEFEVKQIEERVLEIYRKDEMTTTDLKNVSRWIDKWKELTNWETDETPALQLCPTT